jgi:hypothetical protein
MRACVHDRYSGSLSLRPRRRPFQRFGTWCGFCSSPESVGYAIGDMRDNAKGFGRLVDAGPWCWHYTMGFENHLRPSRVDERRICGRDPRRPSKEGIPGIWTAGRSGRSRSQPGERYASLRAFPPSTTPVSVSFRRPRRSSWEYGRGRRRGGLAGGPTHGSRWSVHDRSSGVPCR